MLLFPGTEIEERHLLLLKSTSLRRQWQNLGERLPYISGPHQGHRVKYAFEDSDLAEIHRECIYKDTDDMCFLRSLLREWAGMSNYHTVEVLSQVLRDDMDMGRVAGILLHVKTNDYDEQVK